MKTMKYIGAHVSAAGGVENAPLNAHTIGAKAFALFTKNQKQWVAKPLDKDTIDLWFLNLEKSKILPKHILPHDSYLINLGAEDMEKREKSLNAFKFPLSCISKQSYALPALSLNLKWSIIHFPDAESASLINVYSYSPVALLYTNST